MNSEVFARMYAQISPDDDVIQHLQYRISNMESERKSPKRKIGYLAAACCLLLAISTLFFMPQMQDLTPESDGPHPPINSGEAVVVAGWDDLIPPEQFGIIKWSNNEYTTSSGQLDASLVKEILATVTVFGVEELTGTQHSTQVHLHRIEGINPEAIIAVKYAGHDGYYSAGNHLYTPETLGQFSEDLAFGSYLVLDNEMWDTEDYSVVYRLADTKELTDMLLNYPEARNEIQPDMVLTDQFGNSTLSLGGRLEGVGMTFAITVYDCGYVQTNLLGTAKVYYIGKAQADNAKQYVLSNAAKTGIP